METFEFEQAIAKYLFPKMASMVSKNLRKLTYVEHVKELIRKSSKTESPIFIGLLDNKPIQRVYFEDYIENNIDSNLPVCYMVETFSSNNFTRDDFEDTIFRNVKTGESVLIGEVTAISPPFITSYVEFNPDANEKADTINEVRRGLTLRLDCLSMYNTFMNEIDFESLRNENTKLFKSAVKEYIIETLESYIPAFDLDLESNVFRMLVCYTWFYFNCCACEIQFNYNRYAVEQIVSDILSRDSPEIDYNEPQNAEESIELINSIREDIMTMFGMLKKFVVSIE